MADCIIPEGYKETVFGIIPKEWEVKRIKDIGTVVTGSTPSTSDMENYGNEYLFVSPVDLSGNKYIYNTEKKLSLKGYNLSRKIPTGAVLFTCIGSTIGKMGVTISSLACNQQINAIICNSNVNNEYLFYELSNRAKQIKLLAGEQAVPIVNKSDFENIRILLSPLSEQQKIAEILNVWDKAIEKQTQLIEKLELRKKGLMQQLLTGKKRLPGFSGEWKRVKAGLLFGSSSIRSNKLEPLLSVTQDKGVVPRDMLETRVTMPNGDLSSFKLVDVGDFVISLRSFEGGLEYSKYRGIVSPAYTVLKKKPDISDVFYKVYFKSNDFIQRLAVAVIGIRDGKQISYSDFCYIKIPYPSLQEQNAIANVFVSCDSEILLAKQKLNRFQQQKKGLMQVLLTGKKRVIQ